LGLRRRVPGFRGARTAAKVGATTLIDELDH
jgi:hypothetical protein